MIAERAEGVRTAMDQDRCIYICMYLFYSRTHKLCHEPHLRYQPPQPIYIYIHYCNIYIYIYKYIYMYIYISHARTHTHTHRLWRLLQGREVLVVGHGLGGAAAHVWTALSMGVLAWPFFCPTFYSLALGPCLSGACPPPTHTHTHTLSLSHTHTHTVDKMTRQQQESWARALTNKHKHTHTNTLTNTHSHTLTNTHKHTVDKAAARALGESCGVAFESVFTQGDPMYNIPALPLWGPLASRICVLPATVRV